MKYGKNSNIPAVLLVYLFSFIIYERIHALKKSCAMKDNKERAAAERKLNVVAFKLIAATEDNRGLKQKMAHK